MKALLESKDLLAEPRVIEAYFAIMPPQKHMHKHEQLYVGYDSYGKVFEVAQCPKCSYAWTWSEDKGYSGSVECEIPGPIPENLSLADVAFQMKNKCVAISIRDWDMALSEVLVGRLTVMAQPKDWICAGVIMWKLKAAEATGDVE